MSYQYCLLIILVMWGGFASDDNPFALVDYNEGPQQRRQDLIQLLEGRGIYRENSVAPSRLKEGDFYFRPSSHGIDYMTLMKKEGGKIIPERYQITVDGLKNTETNKIVRPGSRTDLIQDLIAKGLWVERISHSMKQVLLQSPDNSFYFSKSKLGKNYVRKLLIRGGKVWERDYRIDEDGKTLTAVGGKKKTMAIQVMSNPLEAKSQQLYHNCSVLTGLEQVGTLYKAMLRANHKIISESSASDQHDYFLQVQSSFNQGKNSRRQKNYIYGENHGVSTYRQTLIDQMPDLVKKKNVKTLGLEFLTMADQVNLTNFFNASDKAAEEKYLAKIKQNYERGFIELGRDSGVYAAKPDLFDVIRAAKASGINRIVPLDDVNVEKLRGDERIAMQNMVVFERLTKFADPTGGVMVLEGDRHREGIARFLKAKMMTKVSYE